MNYTLHQLRVFLKVSQTRSVTRAAEELHLTQPAVSIQLAQFQQNFNAPLTEVVGRRLYITDFGKDIARSAEKVLNEVAEIDYRTQALQAKLSGRLRFSIVGTAQYLLPFLMRDFATKHPDVEFSIDVTNRRRVSNSLQANEADFGLVSLLPEKLSLHSLELMGNSLQFVAAASLLHKEKPSLRDIQSMPFIFRESGSGTRDRMEEVVAQLNLKVLRHIELSSNEAVKQAIIAGLGCSIVPVISVKNELRQGVLRIIPIKDIELRSTWRLIWLQQKRLSPVAQAFVQYLEQEKDALLNEHFAWLADYDA